MAIVAPLSVAVAAAGWCVLDHTDRKLRVVDIHPVAFQFGPWFIVKLVVILASAVGCAACRQVRVRGRGMLLRPFMIDGTWRTARGTRRGFLRRAKACCIMA